MDTRSVRGETPERAPKQGQASPKQDQRIPDYVLRGLGIVAVAQDLILDSYQGGGRWLVPSGSDPGRHYEVRVGSHPKRNRCECRGFGSHGYCSHVVAASRVAKKSAVCDSCGTRRWWHDLVEVGEDDASLTWFPGDRLCKACVVA
ncbi:MAG: SWIM zinc finger family protein, partial [Actinomycetota bacterium]|nr:SWIM zinc finger family protein [Actinomycetota bacterium]